MLKKIKKIVAVVLIISSSGAWGYLNHLNKKELEAAANARKDLEVARTVAAARAQARADSEATLRRGLAECQAAAEKDRNDFVAAHQKPVPRKRGRFAFAIAPEDLNEAEQMQKDSIARCQMRFDMQMAQVP